MKYPKLNKISCKYPEREECNYTDNQRRCEYMKYQRDGSGYCGIGGHWECMIGKAAITQARSIV